MTKALVVIDVQNGFAVDQAADLPDKIADHIRKTDYEYLLFTVFRNHPDSNFYKILNWKKVTNKPETDLHEALSSFVSADNIFEKSTYSAFKNQKFRQFLENNRINKLSICGIDLDGCVLATGFEAFDLGYDSAILVDLCSVSSPHKDYEAAAKLIIASNLKSNF